MEKRKVILIGAGFTTAQIIKAMGYTDHVEMPNFKTANIGFTQPKNAWDSEELNEKLKNISKQLGISTNELKEKLINALSFNFDSLNDLATAMDRLSKVEIPINNFFIEDIKPSYMYDEPKSKYINKPRHNFKRR